MTRSRPLMASAGPNLVGFPCQRLRPISWFLKLKCKRRRNPRSEHRFCQLLGQIWLERANEQEFEKMAHPLSFAFVRSRDQPSAAARKAKDRCEGGRGCSKSRHARRACPLDGKVETTSARQALLHRLSRT